jgi:Uma2 family endonuclease
MATVTKIGPEDHGRPMTLEEFEAGDYEEGCQYELIDGELYVSPLPNAPQGIVEHWLLTKVLLYSLQRPDVTNFVCNSARVFVPGRRRVTTPEPDLAAFRYFPLHLPFAEIRWQNVSPFLVGEVLSLDDPDKDLVRNVELYHQVPTIKEYWLLDTRDNPDQPTMRVYIRHGKGWRIRDVAYGERYTTRLLPGFELLLDPRR